MGKNSRLTARRSRKFKEKKNNPVFKFKIKKILMTLLVVLTALFFLALIYTNSHKRRIVVAFPQANSSDVAVLVFDPQNSNTNLVLIPTETLVSVSRNLGNWRLKSVWKLSLDEGVYGKLLSETIAKSFKFPVDSWSDTQISGLVSGNIKEMIKSVFGSYRTNLDIFDKLNIFISLAFNRHLSLINLAKTQILDRSTLPDGEMGFSISNTMDDRIASIFSDPIFSTTNATVTIFNQSGYSSKAIGIGTMMEVMGIKVIGNFTKDQADFNCILQSGNEVFIKKMLSIVGCKADFDTSLGKSDIRLYLGKNFVL